jgi:hypothetical protein
LVLIRNCALTVIIGSAMLLQGPDGGIQDLMGDSWSFKAVLLLALGLGLNFRKLRAFGRAFDAALGLTATTRGETGSLASRIG